METALIVFVVTAWSLLFTRGIMEVVQTMISPKPQLSRDQVVEVLYEVIQDSPKLKADFDNLLAPLREELLKAEPIIPLTPFQRLLLTVWFAFVAWASWKAVDFFI